MVENYLEKNIFQFSNNMKCQDMWKIVYLHIACPTFKIKLIKFLFRRGCNIYIDWFCQTQS